MEKKRPSVRKPAARKRGSYDPAGMRARILDESIRIFAREGFFQASFGAIARSIGVSQSAVMNHYPTKVDLIREVVAEVIRRSHAFVSRKEDLSHDARQRLETHFDETAAWALSRPAEAQVLLLFYYMGSWSEEFRAVYESILAAARDRILAIVLAGKREGLFRPKVAPELAAELFHDALLGGILNVISSQRLKRMPKAFTEKREALVRGLL